MRDNVFSCILACLKGITNKVHDGRHIVLLREMIWKSDLQFMSCLQTIISIKLKVIIWHNCVDCKVFIVSDAI